MCRRDLPVGDRRLRARPKNLHGQDLDIWNGSRFAIHGDVEYSAHPQRWRCKRSEAILHHGKPSDARIRGRVDGEHRNITDTGESTGSFGRSPGDRRDDVFAGETGLIPIQNSTGGVTFAVRVHSRAKKNAITGELGDALKVSLTAPPIDGRANDACIDFFAKLLKVNRSSVTIASGHSSRTKVIRVTGLSVAEIRKRIGM